MRDHGPWSYTGDVLQSDAPWKWLRQSKSFFYFLLTEFKKADPGLHQRPCMAAGYTVIGLVVQDGSWGSSAHTFVLTGEGVLGSNQKSST